jgi:hypothetical protein
VFRLVIGFIGYLTLLYTNNYDSLTGYTFQSQSSLAVAWYRLLTTDIPFTLGSRTFPDLSYQLLTLQLQTDLLLLTHDLSEMIGKEFSSCSTHLVPLSVCLRPPLS